MFCSVRLLFKKKFSMGTFCSKTVFNIHNNKCFLSIKSILEGFLKDHLTLMSGVMLNLTFN